MSEPYALGGINPEAIKTNTDKYQTFRDPTSPGLPEYLIGLDTDALLRVGGAAGFLATPHAIEVAPLIVEMQARGTPLSPAEVSRYRKPIKRMIPAIDAVDKMALGASVLGVGVPIRKRLNKKIDAEFQPRVQEQIDTAREKISQIEDDVAFVSEFENPKQQFADELTELAQQTKQSIEVEHQQRLETGQDHLPEITQTGFRGLVQKALREIRKFFGILRQRPSTNNNITAYDAAAGLDIVMRNMLENREATRKDMPLLSGLILDRIQPHMIPSRDHIAFMAPEILTSIFSTVAEDVLDEDLIRSVNLNPHELRFITKFKKRLGRYNLRTVQKAARDLLPAIHDVLPEDGKDIQMMFDRVMQILQPNVRVDFTTTGSKEARTAAKLNWLRMLRGKLRRVRS